MNLHIERGRNVCLSNAFLKSSIASGQGPHCRAISEYLGKQPTSYLDVLVKISQEMGPMNEQCRLSIVMTLPDVLGFDCQLQRALGAFSRQSLSFRDFEIVYVPEGSHPEKFDASIDQFKAQTGCDPVMRRCGPDPLLSMATLGMRRKVAYDAIMVRLAAMKSVHRYGILRCDSNVYELDSHFLASHIRLLCSGLSDSPCVKGKVYVDKGLLCSDPLLFVSYLVRTSLEDHLFDKVGFIGRGDPNMSTSCESYLSVGGYNPELDRSADIVYDSRVLGLNGGGLKVGKGVVSYSESPAMWISPSLAELAHTGIWDVSPALWRDDLQRDGPVFSRYDCPRFMRILEAPEFDRKINSLVGTFIDRYAALGCTAQVVEHLREACGCVVTESADRESFCLRDWSRLRALMIRWLEPFWSMYEKSNSFRG